MPRNKLQRNEGISCRVIKKKKRRASVARRWWAGAGLVYHRRVSFTLKFKDLLGHATRAKKRKKRYQE